MDLYQEHCTGLVKRMRWKNIYSWTIYRVKGSSIEHFNQMNSKNEGNAKQMRKTDSFQKLFRI